MPTDKEQHEETFAELQAAMAEFQALAAEMNEHMAGVQAALSRLAVAVLKLHDLPGIGFPGTSSYEDGTEP